MTGVVRQVRAAGGVVEREGLLAVVHRPRYDDWSLPKGKLDRGETWEDAALREVREETGISCELGEPLPEIRYLDGRGRQKVVRYWRMRAVEGDFAVNDEVDELRWLTPVQAVELLSYEHDRRLVQTLAEGG